MKTLALFALSLVSAVAFAQESHTIPLSYDKAWSAVAQNIVMQGLSISDQDKYAGLIKISGDFSDDTYFTCPRAGGAFHSRFYEINIAVSPDQADSTTISLNALGTERRYRNKKVVFFTVGRVWDEHRCASTGELEKAILSGLL